MLQNLTVGVIVMAAALFATWRLAGAATRLRWLELLAARLSGSSGKLATLLRRQIAQRRAAMLAATGCGACSAAASEGLQRGPLAPRTPKAKL